MFLKLSLLALVIASITACGAHGLQRDRLSFPADFQTQFTDAETPSGATTVPVGPPDISPSDFDTFENQGETPGDREVEKQVPDTFVLQSPVKEPFTISYFYGPRILGSLTYSLDLENHKSSFGTSIPAEGLSTTAFLNKYGQFHTGIDFAVTQGTPVFAAGDGEIFSEGFVGCPGRVIALKMSVPQSDLPLYVLYEHLDSIQKNLQVGSKVHAGDLIGLSGHSGQQLTFKNGVREGCVDGDHLHFELRVGSNDKSVPAKVPADATGRWNFIYSNADKINPAEFIQDVEQKCEFRRALEITNGLFLEKTKPNEIPPLTAGRCNQKFESNLTAEPRLFRFDDQSQISSISGSTAAK